jgi:hypothetical protein
MDNTQAYMFRSIYKGYISFEIGQFTLTTNQSQSQENIEELQDLHFKERVVSFRLLVKIRLSRKVVPCCNVLLQPFPAPIWGCPNPTKTVKEYPHDLG